MKEAAFHLPLIAAANESSSHALSELVACETLVEQLCRILAASPRTFLQVVGLLQDKDCPEGWQTISNMLMHRTLVVEADAVAVRDGRRIRRRQQRGVDGVQCILRVGRQAQQRACLPVPRELLEHLQTTAPAASLAALLFVLLPAN